MSENEWIETTGKKLCSPHNRELVTARVNIINGRKVVRISIGLDVCELIGLKKADRVCLFLHKRDRDLLLISKDNDHLEGYKLSQSASNKSSFLHFAFRYETSESFRLSQTTVLNYDFNNEGVLLVDLEKIKWSK